MRNLQIKCGYWGIFVLSFLVFHMPGYSQTVPYVVDQSTTSDSLKKAFALPNGRSGAIIRTSANRYICMIVNIDGSVANSFDITSQMSPQLTTFHLEVKAIGTPSGNIFIVYTSDEIPNTNQNALYLVLNQAGATVASGIVNSTNRGPLTGLNRYFDLAVLSNGNVVATWEISQENADQTSTSSSGSGIFRIFTEAGVAVTNDIVFAGPGSTIFTSVVNSPGDGVRVAANSGGGFLISFHYYNGNFRAIRFNNSGVAQTTGGVNAFVVDPNVSTGTYHNYEAEGLANGNYVLCWNRSGVAYYKVINSAGVDVKATTSITDPDIAQEASTSGWLGVAAVNTAGKQGFALAIIHWQVYSDVSNPYATVRVYNYDLSGNFLSPTTDITPYFIADPAPKTDLYSGLPTGVGVAYQSYKTFTVTSYGYTVPADADVRGVNVDFTAVSLITDYFRTKTSGNWSDVNTWQSSSDNSTWISATLAPDFNANTITILGTHTVTITSNLTVDQTVVNSGGAAIVNPGIVLTANNGTGTDVTVSSGGSFTLKSTAAGTASIGNSAGTITGNVIVERYIPDDGHRAWRLLSIPVTSSQTIKDAWQEGGASVTGLGTLITSNLYTATNGFDMSSLSSSILQHSQGGVAGPSWTPLTNTNSTTISSNPGYMIFVRGDRTATPSNTTHPTTILRSTGALKQGTQSAVTISATGTGYTLVGNPYASPIDFESIASTPNLNQSFLIWDPNLAGNYGVGGYRLVERTAANTYQQTPQVAGGTVSNNTMRYIHSGQAFFLKATGANASVVFTESSKATQGSSIVPFRIMNNQPQLVANLMIVEANNASTLVDGVRVRFDNSYSGAVTEEDILKMDNFSSENLGLRRNDKILIVEKRPEVAATDTLYLNLANTTNRNYRFQLEGINMPTTLQAYLKDNFTGTQTAINLNSITEVDFSIDSTPATAAANRFSIIFRAASTLPLAISSVKAYEQNNNVAVEWKVQNESGMNEYEIEKSLDGHTFFKASMRKASNNNNSTVNYSWLDVNALTGDNFYRIQSLGLNGDIKYSEIVKVSISKGKSFYTIFPNPINGNNIGLQFIHKPKGIYIVKLINSFGQVMLRKQIVHDEGSSTERIEIDSNIAKGNYTLKITTPEKTNFSIPIVH